MNKLNFGCGTKIFKGYVNVDVVKHDGVDKAFDFNKFPYPFKDNTFEEVLIIGVLEELRDARSVIKEIYRISKNNTVIKLRVPFYNSRVAHYPGHYTFFTMDSFRSFDDEGKIHPASINNGLFKVIKKRIQSTPYNWFIPQKIKNFLSCFIPNISEFIYFELKVIK